MKTKEQYQVSLNCLKILLEDEANCDVAKAAINNLQELIDWQENATLYGMPVDQIIIWGLILKDSGMTIKELREKTDLVRLGFEMSTVLMKEAVRKEAEKRTIK